MPPNLRDDLRRHGNRSIATFGLGWTDDPGPIAEIRCSLGDRDGPRFEVDPLPGEGRQLAEPEPAEGRQEDQRPVPGFDGVGDGVDLLYRRCRAFSGSLDPGAAGDAGVGDDAAVVDGGVEDGTQ